MARNGTTWLVLANIGTPTVPAYSAVGCQRDGGTEETTENIDVSCKDSRAGRYLPGRYGSTLTLDSLYIETGAAYLALLDAMRDGTLIALAKELDGAVYETADAVINSLSESFPDQDAATVSMSATIDGFWSEVGS